MRIKKSALLFLFLFLLTLGSVRGGVTPHPSNSFRKVWEWPDGSAISGGKLVMWLADSERIVPDSKVVLSEEDLWEAEWQLEDNIYQLFYEYCHPYANPTSGEGSEPISVSEKTNTLQRNPKGLKGLKTNRNRVEEEPNMPELPFANNSNSDEK